MCLCVCASANPYECIFLPAVLLEFSCDEACVHGEVSFGDTLVYERLTTKKDVYEREDERLREAERGVSSLCGTL